MICPGSDAERSDRGQQHPENSGKFSAADAGQFTEEPSGVHDFATLPR